MSLVLGVCLRSVICEDVELQCDECLLAQHLCFSGQCTVTGLIINPSQHVVFNVEKNEWLGTVYMMQFKKSSLLHIPQSIFSECSMLARLEMSSTGVKWLDLSHNNISEIKESVFLGAGKLKLVNMSYNRISEMSEHSFRGLKYLVHVHLAYNQFGDLKENIFSDNEFLETVNLEGNHIHHLDVGIFSKMQSLKELNLAGNELNILDPNMFINPHNIDSINISRNRFTNLNNFFIFHNLKRFWASHNQIGKINVGILGMLRNLEILDLKNTSISGLRPGIFSLQRNLIVLDLSHNNLQHLNLNIFQPFMLPRLEELDLNGNNLSEIKGHGFASFSSLKTLGLDGNNFNCSYLLHLISLENFRSNINFNSDVRPMRHDVQYIHGIECVHGEQAAESDNGFITKSPMNYENYGQHLKLLEQEVKLQEQPLTLLEARLNLPRSKLQEQHLLVIMYFVISIFITLLGSCCWASRDFRVFANRKW